MYAEKSKKLVRELKTSKWLPPYNSNLVSEISTEITNLHGKLSDSLNNNQEALAVLQAGFVDRNKRGVLAYLNYRTSKLESLRIETGPNIPPHFSNQLCNEEIEYFRKYSALLQEYSRKVCKYIDITTDLTPPKDLYIEVLVREDVGDIVLPVTGPITLKKNTVQLLRREDAATLVRQGVLQQTN
jgi:hypothetical protein